MKAQHINFGARGRNHVVDTEEQRWSLLARLASALDGGLLAFCILATHVHLVANGARETAIAAVEAAIAAFVRETGRGAKSEQPLLRGPVHAVEKNDPFELMRSINYVHKNACHAPGIEQSYELPWCSQLAYMGLRIESAANVAIALELLGRECRDGVRGPILERADLVRPNWPELPPTRLAAAAAAVFELPPADLASDGLGERVMRARAVFLRLGLVERHKQKVLAPFLGRSASQASRILKLTSVTDDEVKIARTVARDPGIARHLPQVQMSHATGNCIGMGLGS